MIFLYIKTLSGFFEFIKMKEKEKDKIINKENNFISIENYKNVKLYRKDYNDNLEFELIAECKFSQDCDFPFTDFLNQEEFVIKLMTFFQNNDVKENLLSMISNVQTDHISISQDDGISQEVTIKKGLHFKERAKLPLYLNLKPFWTFPEIETVEEIFILRLKKNRDDSVLFALFPAGSLTWKIDLNNKIFEWLKNRLENWTIIK